MEEAVLINDTQLLPTNADCVGLCNKHGCELRVASEPRPDFAKIYCKLHKRDLFVFAHMCIFERVCVYVCV